jgi:uncharacterized protein YhfF
VERTPATDALWREFVAGTGSADDGYAVVAFGGEHADLNAGLVVEGTKRATVSLLREYDGGEPVPRPGDHWVVVDGGGRPRCVCRTTEVRVKPMIEVDDAFAWDEGEGDRTRPDWLEGHRAYYRRAAEREGWRFHDGLDTVFERFTVVWPPALADPPG